MTIEEHVRAAEHHMTEAYAQMKRAGIAWHTATIGWRRIKTMLLNILGLCAELRKLDPQKQAADAHIKALIKQDRKR